MNITGALNLQSATNNVFTIKLVSLTSSNTPGPVDGFDSAGSHSWTLATVGGGIQNFLPAKFAVDTSAFSNPLNGVFTVSTNAGSLRLNYAGEPLVAPLLFGPTLVSNNLFGFSFSGPGGQSYRVLAATNLTLPLSNWMILTSGVFSAGPASYVDPLTNSPLRFYRVASP